MKTKSFTATAFELIRDFIIKQFIRLVGLRFYEQASGDSGHGETLVGQSDIRSLAHTSVQFRFYRKTYRDIIYKRGKVRTEVFIGYSIECTFDDSFSHVLKSYNNLKFVVRQKSLRYIQEKAMMHILVEFYLEFITNEIKKNEKFISGSSL
jgi:hypothetical protein